MGLVFGSLGFSVLARVVLSQLLQKPALGAIKASPKEGELHVAQYNTSVFPSQ